MKVMRAIATALATWDEASLREAFEREILAPQAGDRAAAVRKLHRPREEKTILLLVSSLKDPATEVRKAAAEAIESGRDVAGGAIKPLGDILADKREPLDLRLACAKALARAEYKAEPFTYFYKTISSIEREERQFHEFGARVVAILDRFVGRSFGADKTTAERWGEWWIDNKDRLAREDAKTREEWKNRKRE